jgi:hypothetical protein
MNTGRELFRGFARGIASVIPAVDGEADHERWDAGIGPFEEDRQVEMIVNRLADRGIGPSYIETEVRYPGSGRQCDLSIGNRDFQMPIEAKLLRFRRDNGNIDPNMYKSVFSPFPERSSSSLLTDAVKLTESAFDPPYGLLGLYYQKDSEEYEQLTADLLAEKFERDIEFWYEMAIDTIEIARFDGLRHPYHQHGAVIAWIIPG